MHPALLRAVLLPPPAPGPRVGARRDRPRARRAADALIALVIERVVRQIVGADVVPDLLVRPVRQWVDLDDAAVVVVELDLADVGACGPLVAPQAGDPRVESEQDLHQWAELAHVATRQAQRHRFVEQVHAVAAHQRLQLPCVGEVRLDFDAVLLPHPVDQVVCLLWQTTGIDGEHAHVRTDAPGHIQDGHAITLEAGADGHAILGERVERPRDDLLRLVVVVLDRQLASFPFIQNNTFVQCDRHPAKLPLRRDWRGLAGPDTDQLFIAFALCKRLERLAVLAFIEVCADQALHVSGRLFGRHTPKQRAADFGVFAESAPQIDLVGLELVVAGFVATRGRALQADVAHPVVRARVQAAVDTELDSLDVATDALLQAKDDLLQLGLGLGDREVAQRLTSAAHAGAANGVHVQRKTDVGDATDHLIDAALRHVGDDEVLLPRQADVAVELGGQAGDLDRLLARHLSEANGEADVVQASLLLAMRAEVVGVTNWLRHLLQVLQLAAELLLDGLPHALRPVVAHH